MAPVPADHHPECLSSAEGHTSTSSIVQQQQQTLSPFGIEPGVCLKNVAAIITQQQRSSPSSSPSTKAQPVTGAAAARGEVPQEVVVNVDGGATTTRDGEEEGKRSDFHFDKHSQFTGNGATGGIRNIKLMNI